MANRQAWIENATRRGKNGVIEHFNIPKMHITRHFVQHVWQKGSVDNFSTETMEHFHVGVKEAYRSSNCREWKQQTVRWLTQCERMRDFEVWMVWCDEYENAYCTREWDEQALNHEVDHEDSADGSSIGGSVVEGAGKGESDGEEGAPSDTEGEAEPRGPDEYEDPDEYGERLVH
ncbi:hypothetical protein FRC06_009897, partial [Ceratobasidium sp. 370]